MQRGEPVSESCVRVSTGSEEEVDEVEPVVGVSSGQCGPSGMVGTFEVGAGVDQESGNLELGLRNGSMEEWERLQAVRVGPGGEELLNGVLVAARHGALQLHWVGLSSHVRFELCRTAWNRPSTFRHAGHLMPRCSVRSLPS